MSVFTWNVLLSFSGGALAKLLPCPTFVILPEIGGDWVDLSIFCPDKPKDTLRVKTEAEIRVWLNKKQIDCVGISSDNSRKS